MNTQKAQNEINKLVLKNRLERQYPASKRDLAKLTELGIIDMMPICKHPSCKAIGGTDAKRVIEAAEKKPGAVMNAYGEGDEIGASALWLALNEAEETNDGDGDGHNRETKNNLNLFVIEHERSTSLSVEVQVHGWYNVPAGAPGEDYENGTSKAYIRPARKDEILAWIAAKIDGSHTTPLYTPLPRDICEKVDEYTIGTYQVAAIETEKGFLAQHLSLDTTPRMYTAAKSSIWNDVSVYYRSVAQ
jgi:hypothetical protein